MDIGLLGVCIELHDLDNTTEVVGGTRLYEFFGWFRIQVYAANECSCVGDNTYTKYIRRVCPMSDNSSDFELCYQLGKLLSCLSILFGIDTRIRVSVYSRDKGLLSLESLSGDVLGH